MNKPYTRGSFRAIKSGNSYVVEAKRIESPDDAPHWMPIMSFDYLGTARQRVRNLHSACCAQFEFLEFLNRWDQKRIKTGK